jgi:hypothetical protein
VEGRQNHGCQNDLTYTVRSVQSSLNSRGKVARNTMHSITIKTEDARTAKCDVFVLKYAQAFFGADYELADALGMTDERLDLPTGSHLFVTGSSQG